MIETKQFYQELHDGDYAGGSYNLKSLLSMRVMQKWLANAPKAPFRALDVGCGRGVFLRDLVHQINRRWGISQIEATGTDLVRSPGDVFSQISDHFRFVEHNLDGKTLPFKDGSFDFVCCNHVLEHIFETEKLVREFRRVLDPNGLCIISVPNVACWKNRLEFLVGGQPLGSELGTEKLTYGVWPRFLQKQMETWHPSGHIRDFTPRGLQDLTRHCGFETLGWWKQSNKFIGKLGKWAGLEMGILLKRAKD